MVFLFLGLTAFFQVYPSDKMAEINQTCGIYGQTARKVKSAMK
jgi:hypothetical protein